MRIAYFTILFSFLIVCILSFEGCKRSYNDEPVGTTIAFITPNGWPQTKYDFLNNQITEEGFELGRKLFYDGKLSADGNYSCGGCHQQIAAFGTFDHDLSHGINNTHTIRNAPPLQNLAWQTAFGLDGASKTLDEQITKHITSPTQMGETVENVVNKLSADNEYKKMFAAAYGDDNITSQRMTKALSQFILMLVSSNSTYDKVLKGQSSFNAFEQNGYNLFKAKCASCHTEPMFTDYSYRNIGIPVDDHLKDYGRLRVTTIRADSLKFKMPSLRNTTATNPFAHDGRMGGYDQVLEHYRSGVISGPTTDPSIINKIALTNFEFGQLKSFLATLTDTGFINNKKFAPR